jgi:hypothetical protein
VPQIRRQLAIAALAWCVLATAGITSATAMPTSTKPPAAKAATPIKQKSTGSLCKKADRLRKIVIRKSFKKYIKAPVSRKKAMEKARRSPGLDICKYGTKGGKKPKHTDKVRYVNTLRRIAWPPKVAVVVPAAQPVASTTATSSAQTAATSTPAPAAGGKYCGLFQFDQSTWQSVGGSGSPCAASEGEQWERAKKLYQQRGNSPWPKCGKYGASLEQIVNCESSGNPQAVGG